MQDAFVNAYRGLSQLEDTAKFKGWLAEIARNCARDRLRKQSPETVPIDEVMPHELETSDSVGAQLIRDEQRELIRRAIGTLPGKDREIAQAYYLDGASYEEAHPHARVVVQSNFVSAVSRETDTRKAASAPTRRGIRFSGDLHSKRSIREDSRL